MVTKRTETSKLVLGCVLILCGIFAIAIMFGWCRGLDGAPEMLGIVAGTAGTVIGFYSWKAKAENLIKLSREEIDSDLMAAISKMREAGEA